MKTILLVIILVLNFSYAEVVVPKGTDKVIVDGKEAFPILGYHALSGNLMPLLSSSGVLQSATVTSTYSPIASIVVPPSTAKAMVNLPDGKKVQGYPMLGMDEDGDLQAIQVDGQGRMITSEGGAVESVNGQTGAVSLDAADVGADPAGSSAVKQNKGSNVYHVGSTREHTTIQAALTAIGNAANITDNKTPVTVYIDGGIYNEDLTIPTGRVVSLLANGTVILGDGAGANFSSNNTRSISWSSEVSHAFSGNPPRPALMIGVVHPSDATSTFITQAGCWRISGNIAITGGLSNTLVLSGVEVNGTLTSGAALTNLHMYRSYIKGAVTGAAMVLSRIQDSQFDALISVNGYNYISGSEIKAGLTVTTISNTLPPNGMYKTTFTGAFTGPANSLRLDPVTNYFFTTNGATLGGSASKVMLASLGGESVTYTPGTSSDWAGAAPTTVKQALDRMASLLKTLNSGAAIP